MISVLMPTRSRSTLLREAIASYRDLSSALVNLEIIVAMDRDDEESLACIKELKDIKVIVSDRYGYTRLHEYYNNMARLATGDWLYLVGDDTMMCTQNWDVIISTYDHNSFTAVVGTQSASPNPCFAAVSRYAYNKLGFLSKHPTFDIFIERMFKRHGNFIFPIPVHMQHTMITMGSLDANGSREIDAYIVETASAVGL